MADTENTGVFTNPVCSLTILRPTTWNPPTKGKYMDSIGRVLKTPRRLLILVLTCALSLTEYTHLLHLFTTSLSIHRLQKSLTYDTSHTSTMGSPLKSLQNPTRIKNVAP